MFVFATCCPLSNFVSTFHTPYFVSLCMVGGTVSQLRADDLRKWLADFVINGLSGWGSTSRVLTIWPWWIGVSGPACWGVVDLGGYRSCCFCNFCCFEGGVPNVWRSWSRHYLWSRSRWSMVRVFCWMTCSDRSCSIHLSNLDFSIPWLLAVQCANFPCLSVLPVAKATFTSPHEGWNFIYLLTVQFFVLVVAKNLTE